MCFMSTSSRLLKAEGRTDAIPGDAGMPSKFCMVRTFVRMILGSLQHNAGGFVYRSAHVGHEAGSLCAIDSAVVS